MFIAALHPPLEHLDRPLETLVADAAASAPALAVEVGLLAEEIPQSLHLRPQDLGVVVVGQTAGEALVIERPEGGSAVEDGIDHRVPEPVALGMDPGAEHELVVAEFVIPVV